MQGVGADLGVVGCEGAILEDGLAEQVRGGHGDDQTGFFQGSFEVPHDAVAFGGGGVNGDQVVVVEVDAVGADIGQEMDEFDRGLHFAHWSAEWIAADVADRPQA